jgi:hypothetical protein
MGSRLLLPPTEPKLTAVRLNGGVDEGLGSADSIPSDDLNGDVEKVGDSAFVLRFSPNEVR